VVKNDPTKTPINLEQPAPEKPQFTKPPKALVIDEDEE
jgi:hypothetical protein